jgi:hypothetical protein
MVTGFEGIKREGRRDAVKNGSGLFRLEKAA